MAKEFYDVLGVSENASADEIKKAYRKKAMELHPDRHGGDKQKEAEFKKLNEAYSVLSDTEKKSNYDRFWSAEGMGGFWGGFGGGFEWVDINDIFSSFFGGGFGGGGRGGRRRDIGEDIEMKIRISLEDAIMGVSRKIEFDRSASCHHCGWKGGKTEKCGTCHGSGQVRERVQTVFGVMEQSRTCGTCHGTGEKIIERCTHCHGKGKIHTKIEKTIDIPAGIESGMSIKMRAEGHEGHDGNGDLYLTFDIPDKEGGLTRDGADLHYAVHISPAEAVLGNTRTIEIPILGKKSLSIESGTQSGVQVRYRGEWIARLDRKGHKGDLIIEIIIETPTKLSSEERALYEALYEIESGKKVKKWFFDGLF
jgi:molecular chaperone DnaJ